MTLLASYFSDLVDWAPALWRGVRVTVAVTLVAYVLSLAIGLAVALARTRRYPGYRIVRPLLVVYVEVLRGLPLIVTLFILFFGLPAVGVTISGSPVVVGTVGLSLALGAYLSEVLRAAILAVDPGQMEAALSLGMTRRQAFARIVVPQALLIAVPTLGGYFIGLLKDTSLLGFISVIELLRVGMQIVSSTFQAFSVYLTVGAVYLALSLIAARVVVLVERALRPAERDLGRLTRDGTLSNDPLLVSKVQ